MRKTMMMFAVVVLALLVVGAGCGRAKIAEDAVTVNTSQTQTGLSVSAEGEVYVTPDVAMLNLGIEAEGKTVGEAQAQAAGAMEAVMAALSQAGVADRDIQTSRYSIEAVRKWDKDTEDYILTGYRVTNIVTVKIRKLDQTGQVIDDVTRAGGDLTRVDSIGFMVEDPVPYQEQAREEAVDRALAKAGQLTDFSGVTLGDLLYMTESSGYVVPIYRGDVAPSAPGGGAITPVSPGQQKITVTVTMVFSLK